MAWTPISKPSLIAYINVNPGGKEQYDQASLTYDDVNTYYDGINPNQWTDIAKPSVLAWVAVAKPT